MKEIETLEKKSDSDEENPMDVVGRRHCISSSDNEELVDQNHFNQSLHSISSSDNEELVDQDHFNQSLDPDEPANCSIDSQNFLNL